MLGSRRYPQVSQGFPEWRWRQSGQSCVQGQSELGAVQKEAYMYRCLTRAWASEGDGQTGRRVGFLPWDPTEDSQCPHTLMPHRPHSTQGPSSPRPGVSASHKCCRAGQYPSRVGAELGLSQGHAWYRARCSHALDRVRLPRREDGWAGAPGRGAGRGEGRVGLWRGRLAVSLAWASPTSNHNSAEAVQDSHFSSS